MSVNKKINSWATEQALAILAVGGIEPSEFGYGVIRRLDAGRLTHAETKKIILNKARAKVLVFK